MDFEREKNKLITPRPKRLRLSEYAAKSINTDARKWRTNWKKLEPS